MKILVYNRHFFPNIGGTEISGRIMARELAILGHAVTVVTATPLPDHIHELDEGYAIVRGEQFTTLTQHARASDVVFGRGGVSLRAFVAALRGGVPFVAIQEFDASAGRAGSGVRRYATDAMKALVSRHARLHVVVSDALHATLALPAGANLVKLYNPVADDLWTAAPPGACARDLDVLFVGRLVADKGLMVLRDALGAMRRPGRLRIAIAGNGDDRIGWEDAFREVAGEVTFLGPVAGNRLRDLYASARVVVMPSIVKEGMGMVAAEALANGTPVCASDQPALREVVGDAGLFHPMGDAARLAKDLDRILGDLKLWQYKSERAQVLRLRFSMLQYRANLAALVNKCATVFETAEQTTTSHAKQSAEDGEGSRS